MRVVVPERRRIPSPSPMRDRVRVPTVPGKKSSPAPAPIDALHARAARTADSCGTRWTRPPSPTRRRSAHSRGPGRCGRRRCGQGPGPIGGAWIDLAEPIERLANGLELSLDRRAQHDVFVVVVPAPTRHELDDATCCSSGIPDQRQRLRLHTALDRCSRPTLRSTGSPGQPSRRGRPGARREPPGLP